MRILYFLIFLCLVASAAFVFKGSSPPHLEYEDTLQKHTLDNGLTVIIKSSHKVPLVAAKLIIKTGSATEGKFVGSGISHFVEHMLLKSTPTRPVGEIGKQIKSYGGYINAATAHDTTEIYFIAKKEHLKEELELLSDCVFNPSFDETEFEKEREVILNEIRLSRDEPSHRAAILLWGNAYLVHPYRYPVIGYEDLFRQVKREDLIEYHKANYVPNNMVLSIVGDIEDRSALKAVEDIFGKVPRKVDVQTVVPEEPLQMSTRRAEEELPELKLSHVLMAFHSTSLADKDLYPLDLLAAAVGQGESSRLYRKLIRDEKLAYSVSAYNYTPKHPGLFIIGLALEDDKIENALAEVLSELKKIKAHSLLRSELNKVKRSTLSSYIYGRESIEAQADDYVSSYAATGDYDFSKRYIEGINAVKISDVLRVANEYLKPENMTIAMVRPEKKAVEDVGALSKKGKEFDIKKMVLPNGVTLLMYEDRSTPVISMNVLFKGGVRVENKTTNGISYLMSNMLLKGTGFHSAKWISKETESRGIILTSFSGKNSFGISLKCLKNDFNFSLKLVSDILNNSRFPQKEIKILRDIQLAAIRAQDDDIFATASKTLIKTIFKSHPYGMPDLGTKESVNNLGREDLLKYYRRFVVPDNAVVSIFGDIDIDKMQGKIIKTFNSLRGGRLGEIKVLREPKQIEPRQSIKQMPKEQAVLMMGYPGVDVKNPDKYAFDIINSMLSHAGGRLYMNIREKLGLSYTLGSFSVLGIDPGYNAFYVATSYKNVEEAKKLVLNQIKLLRAEGPTQEEMDLAKSDLSGAYFRSLEVNSEIGFKAGLDELYGLGYDEIFKYSAMIESVTAADVMRVANKYFVDSKLNLVIISPSLANEPILTKGAK